MFCGLLLVLFCFFVYFGRGFCCIELCLLTCLDHWFT